MTREMCDDGNTKDDDGCSADCMRFDTGWTCTREDGKKSDCSTVCGDKIIVPDWEVCDDGDTYSGDGCTFNCLTIENGWTCEFIEGYGTRCVNDCGDGKLYTEWERCDDNNTVSGDGCSSDCQTVESGWYCTAFSRTKSICTTECGDGIVAGEEICDDGLTGDESACEDGCSGVKPNVVVIENDDGSTTYTENICGDGITHDNNEVCDDGEGGHCKDDCLGYDDGWVCDTSSPSVCLPVCGDGKLVGDEVCDAGDLDLFSCTTDCVSFRDGFLCSGGDEDNASICEYDLAASSRITPQALGLTSVGLQTASGIASTGVGPQTVATTAAWQVYRFSVLINEPT